MRITFNAEVVTDPVGVELVATVDDSFGDEAQQALVNDVREKLVGQQNNLVFASVRVAHGTLRSYGSRNDYAVEPVTESVEIIETTATDSTFRVRWGWTHEAAEYFQFGVSPHTINGTPLLSFIWEDAPDGVREMFEHTERVDGDPRDDRGFVVPAAVREVPRHADAAVQDLLGG